LAEFEIGGVVNGEAEPIGELRRRCPRMPIGVGVYFDIRERKIGKGGAF
jgi:hypothetical protein